MLEFFYYDLKYPVFYMIMLQMLSICLIQLITLCLSHICRSNSPRSWRWCAFRHERGGSTPFVIHLNYFYFSFCSCVVFRFYIVIVSCCSSAYVEEKPLFFSRTTPKGISFCIRTNRQDVFHVCFLSGQL